MVRRLGLGKNNRLTYTSLTLNPRFIPEHFFIQALATTCLEPQVGK